MNTETQLRNIMNNACNFMLNTETDNDDHFCEDASEYLGN